MNTKERMKKLKNMEERKLTVKECESFKRLIDAAIVPGVTTTTELVPILEILENMAEKENDSVEKNLKFIENKLRKELGNDIVEQFKDEFEKLFKQEFKNFEKAFRSPTMDLSKEEMDFLDKVQEKLTKVIIKGKGLSSYIATFGSGQEHEGKYILIHTDSYRVAVDYMEKKYSNSYCMVYPYEEWKKWENKAIDNGLDTETQLEEIVLMRKE